MLSPPPRLLLRLLRFSLPPSRAATLPRVLWEMAAKAAADAAGELVAAVNEGRDPGNALRTLIELNDRDESSRDAAVEAGVIPALVQVLGDGDPNAHNVSAAARALRNIFGAVPVAVARARDEGVLPALVTVLNTAKPESDSTQWAIRALSNIAFAAPQLKVAVVEAGAVPSLVTILRAVPPTSYAAEKAAWVLANVAKDNDVGKRALHEAGAIAPLLTLMEGAGKSAGGAKRAVFALLRAAQYPSARPELARHDAVRRLLAFDHTEEDALRAALLAAVTAGGNEEAEKLAGNPETLKIVASGLRDKIASDPIKYSLRLSDYVQGVAMLTVNEDNKRAMVDLSSGESVVLPLLRVLAEDHPCELDVKADAAKALWNLALTDDIRGMMESKQQLVPKMMAAKEAFKGTGHGSLIKSIDGVLFECGVRDELAKARVARGSGAEESTAEGSPSSLPWVMISYNWSHQTVALHLRDELRARGYNVWIDVERMEGDVIEAMAEAVEGSAAVVSIMTSAYKQSPNCQSELKYTNKLRKPIVPVVAEPGYRPDGWLGLILGDKLYYDFRKEERWVSSVEGVVKELTRHTASMRGGGGGGAGGGGSRAAGAGAPTAAADVPASKRTAPPEGRAAQLSRDCIACGSLLGGSNRVCARCGCKCFCLECGDQYSLGKEQKFCGTCGASVSNRAVSSALEEAAATSAQVVSLACPPLSPREGSAIPTRDRRAVASYAEDQGIPGVLTKVLSHVLTAQPPDPLLVLSRLLKAAHYQAMYASPTPPR